MTTNKTRLFNTQIELKAPQDLSNTNTVLENDIIIEKKEKILEMKKIVSNMENVSYFTKDAINDLLSLKKNEVDLEYEIKRERIKLKYEKELTNLNCEHLTEVVARQKKARNWCIEKNKKFQESQAKNMKVPKFNVKKEVQVDIEDIEVLKKKIASEIKEASEINNEMAIKKAHLCMGDWRSAKAQWWESRKLEQLQKGLYREEGMPTDSEMISARLMKEDLKPEWASSADFNYYISRDLANKRLLEMEMERTAQDFDKAQKIGKVKDKIRQNIDFPGTYSNTCKNEKCGKQQGNKSRPRWMNNVRDGQRHLYKNIVSWEHGTCTTCVYIKKKHGSYDNYLENIMKEACKDCGRFWWPGKCEHCEFNRNEKVPCPICGVEKSKKYLPVHLSKGWCFSNNIVHNPEDINELPNKNKLWCKCGAHVSKHYFKQHVVNCKEFDHLDREECPHCHKKEFSLVLANSVHICKKPEIRNYCSKCGKHWSGLVKRKGKDGYIENWHNCSGYNKKRILTRDGYILKGKRRVKNVVKRHRCDLCNKDPKDQKSHVCYMEKIFTSKVLTKQFRAYKNDWQKLKKKQKKPLFCSIDLPRIAFRRRNMLKEIDEYNERVRMHQAKEDSEVKMVIEDSSFAPCKMTEDMKMFARSKNGASEVCPSETCDRSNFVEIHTDLL